MKKDSHETQSIALQTPGLETVELNYIKIQQFQQDFLDWLEGPEIVQSGVNPAQYKHVR